MPLALMYRQMLFARNWASVAVALTGVTEESRITRELDPRILWISRYDPDTPQVFTGIEQTTKAVVEIDKVDLNAGVAGWFSQPKALRQRILAGLPEDKLICFIR